MNTATRWRTAVLVVLVAALAQPIASAQSRDGGATSTTTGSGTSTDGGATGAPLAQQGDAGVSATTSADGGAMVSSGAGGTDNLGSAIADSVREQPAAAVAPRPDPTAAQIEALRLLEDEVNGFTQRGVEYQRSINGLLRREHDNQIARLRSGFDRQIAAERDAEGQARRHAIQVFERFLELYPEDADHTPDVMFRLAELYYDESAYAKLEADEALDRLRAQREAAGQPTDDLVAPPVDYRCSILLYRHIDRRFQSFRLRDATNYLLGWVLKEMGREDESMTSYRGLVCPARFHYEAGLDLAAPLTPGQETPVACQHLFDILRPFGPDLITPPGSQAANNAAGADGGAGAPAAGSGDTGINATLVAAGQPTDTDPMPIPQDYASCTPLNGANGRPSRYAGEVWYYIGDYHFDNPPLSSAELGNAFAIAAYEASMRASEQRRPGLTAANAARTGEDQNQQPASQGPAGQSDTGNGVTAANSPGRAQFSADTQYGPFWSKSLYKIGWSYFRMTNGYPRALEAFSRLLDYYDWAGAEVAAQGNRSDTIKWIGVIFSESSWGAATTNDAIDCQNLVETVARPPREATRPFDCAGIMRITSPLAAAQIAALRDANAARALRPVPGRPTYIPQDRPWTPEAYLELANNYFQQTKYYEAITLYRMFLNLYPLHFQAPRVAENIAISYERQRQFDMAIAARGRLADYTEHSRWWDANNSHPDAQRYAELIARNSLHDNAIQHHQRASAARTRSVQFNRCALGSNQGDVCGAARTARERGERQAQALAELQRANEEYALAIEAYNQFIQNYPNDEAAYEFRYNRADAMFWAGRYADAARAYGEVRESNENDQYLAAAAFMAVKALEAQIRTQAEARTFDACLAVRAGIPADQLHDTRTGAPLLDATQAQNCTQVPTAGTPAQGQRAQITPLNVPDVVRALMDARISYTNRVPRALDSVRGLQGVFTSDGNAANDPPFRPKFAYLNARTLMRFGQVQEAEARLRQVLTTYCNDPTVAGAALADLLNMMLLQGREDDREALAQQQIQHRCAEAPGGTSNNATLNQIVTDSRFRHAMDTFRQAERASGQESLALYERAANEMRAAVDANRNHPQAPLATFYTALAYERTNRFDTATQTYIRITQDYNNLTVIGSNPPRDLEGADRQERINILEVSNFRAAVNLERTFDYDNAIRYYGNVVNDARFATAQDHASHMHDAYESIALIHTNLGHWQQARDAWRTFTTARVGAAEPGRERATAQYRIAEMSFRAQNWADAVRSLRDYRRTTPMSADTAEFHVQAQYNIAQALRNQGDQNGYRRELRAVAQVFTQSGQQPGSRAAAYAAEALFLDLDQRVTAFMQRTLTQGTGDQLAAQVRSLATELDGIDAQASQVLNLRGGEYSIGAVERQGEAHEYLATQEVRIATLLQLSHAQTQQIARAEAGATRLEHLADQLGGRNQALETRLRNQAQQIRDNVQNMRDQMTTQVQQRFDQEAEAQRQLAIQNYAIAIHLARRDNVPTQFAARATEHIRLEENRPLIDAAMRAQGFQTTARNARFTYTQGMFDTEAPGADLTQQQPVATPGLAGE